MAIMEITRHRAVIAGYVTDSVTGQAIPNAVVKITAKNLQAVAGADGFYFFLDLRAGQYTLNVAAPGLGSRYGAVKITNVGVQNAPSGRPVFDSKANVVLPPTRLSGTVKRSSDAQPVKNAVVRILGSEAQAMTDQNGKYAIAGLLAGAPNVQASAAGYAAAAKKVTLTAGQETIADFSLT